MSVSPSELSFEPTPIDFPSTIELELQNLGGRGGTVDLSVGDAQLTLSEASVFVPSTDTVSVELRYSPSVEALDTTLTLAWSSSSLELPVTGSADPDGDRDGFSHQLLGGDDCDDSNADVSPDADEIWYDGVDMDCAGDSDFDVDLDGYELGGGDCDDHDPAVHPQADEVWYDGVDADCAGDSDYDADRDTHDAEPWGDDCDDTDARISPSAVELWYDGVDRDCAGDSDYDADADGYDRPSRGDDCDDTDPAVNPDAHEQPNGVDDDCDGAVDE